MAPRRSQRGGQPGTRCPSRKPAISCAPTTTAHLVGLIHGGRTIGLQSRAAVSDYDGLRTIDGWAIVHLDPGAGHFVVLLRWTPWAVGDGSEPRPHVHAPRRLRTGVQPLRRRIPADCGTTATPLARRAGSPPPGSSSRAAAWHVLAVSCAAPGPRSSSHHRWCSGTSSIACYLEVTRRCSPSWLSAGRPRRRASDDPPRPGRRRGWRAATHLTPRRRESCCATSPRFPRVCTTRGALPDSYYAP